MAASAHVTSVESLEAFRASLIVFRSTAMRALDEAASEVARMRQWLRHDQRLHWEGELRRRQKRLDEAQQEYMRARLSSLQDSTSEQQNAVARARRAMHEAEEKLRAVKKWDRNFDLVVDPIAKQLGALRNVVEQELPKGIAFLANAQHALDAYSGRQAAPSETPADGTAHDHTGDETLENEPRT